MDLGMNIMFCILNMIYFRGAGGNFAPLETQESNNFVIILLVDCPSDHICEETTVSMDVLIRRCPN